MINLKSLEDSKGEANLLLIIVLLGFVVMFIFLFSTAVLVSHINAIMYTVKVDMFTINRSAVIALNKKYERGEISSINRDAYYDYFKKVLQYNYKLDNNLEAGNRLIEKIDILQYEYYTGSTVDDVTGKAIDEPTIHAQIGVRVKPIVFRTTFSELFYFRIHQDVKVNRIAR